MRQTLILYVGCGARQSHAEDRKTLFRFSKYHRSKNVAYYQQHRNSWYTQNRRDRKTQGTYRNVHSRPDRSYINAAKCYYSGKQGKKSTSDRMPGSHEDMNNNKSKEHNTAYCNYYFQIRNYPLRYIITNVDVPRLFRRRVPYVRRWWVKIPHRRP